MQDLIRHVIADSHQTKDHGDWIDHGAGIAETRDVGPETRRGWRRAAAALTLWKAANPDPLAAALDTVDQARLAFPQDAPNFYEAVRRRLA